ncbi:MAG: ABC transporter ATP-binding protein [Chloroflexi bacterium]|nr:ABC transporter ATP-binding protein [Chloroflexota bacterium]
MGAAQAVLEVQDVWKAFGQLQVLKGVTLSVRPGEAVAVVGENGSGKSTLLKVLTGLERPDRAQIRLSGRVGYCPQRLEIYEGLTVAENMIYFGAAYGLPEETLRERGRFYLERFRFAQFTDTLGKNLSEGTKQKLNLTLALLHSPDLLLLDEPYQGFDYETFLNFAGMLQEWRAQGKAVLTISHLVTPDLGLDRVLELADGVVHEQPPPRHGS